MYSAFNADFPRFIFQCATFTHLDSTEYGTCFATGDPHYKTFDNLWHDFQGICRYTLAKDCTQDAPSSFSVEVDNRLRSAEDTVSYTYEVAIIIGNMVKGRLGKWKKNH